MLHVCELVVRLYDSSVLCVCVCVFFFLCVVRAHSMLCLIGLGCCVGSLYRYMMHERGVDVVPGSYTCRNAYFWCYQKVLCIP